ncbi:hypothetical protein IJ670_01400 [bacterium]|nr:hypothetical protein [bacterium]
MYYNIKINAKGSELVLESNNKSVAQKEMDACFAYVFRGTNNPIIKEKRQESKRINARPKTKPNPEINDVLGMIFENKDLPTTTLVRESLISNSDYIPKQQIQDEVDFKLAPEKEIMSFKDFLRNYNVKDIRSEFLICAFYIKNVLAQNSFTMKSINSKLFHAAGRIADTSILDELIKRNFIKPVFSDTFKQYTITELGEKHILNKLPVKK